MAAKMSNKILAYLTALEANNNREWYHANKKDLDMATEEFEGIIQSLIWELGKSEPTILGYAPEELTFKLARDTRFSHDKSPYNPAFRCHISPAGKLPIPVGYYLSIRPRNRSFLGGGLFADMFKDATQMIREYISSHPKELKAVLSLPGFHDGFEIKGTALKNVPKNFDANHPMAEYLKYKSWYIEMPFEDKLLENPQEFVEFATSRYLLMKPFNDFLNCALADFKMPKR